MATVINDLQQPYILEIMDAHIQREFDKYYQKNREDFFGMDKQQMLDNFKIDFPSWEGGKRVFQVYFDMGGNLNHLKVPKPRQKKKTPAPTLLERLENGTL